MRKWIAIIAVLFFGTLKFSFAKTHHNILYLNFRLHMPVQKATGDTTLVKNTKKEDEEKKIKLIGKSKKLPKPEKLLPGSPQDAEKARQKPKRQRRPEGLDRPPEIPRRNGS